MVRHSLSKNIFFFSSISSSSSSSSSVRALLSQFCHCSSSLNSPSLLRRHYHESQNIPVSVWWDFENCHAPSDLHILRIPHYIKEAVRAKGIFGPLKIKAFGDVYKLSRSNQEALAHTGIKMIHVPQGGKNSADKSLLIDLMFWVSQNPPPAHLLLISSDKDFAEVLHRLRMNNYNILVAGTETSYLLCNVATIVWRWYSLCRGENLEGVHFNHPPDGFYGSWCGHHDAPLEDASSDGKQFAHSETEEFPKPISGLKVRPIPKAVVRRLHQILNLYPNGITLSHLRKELEKAGICLDKDYYGYKRFPYFLSSVVHVYLQAIPDRGLIVYYIPKESPESDNTSERLNADDKYAEATNKVPDGGCLIGGSMDPHSNNFSKPQTFLSWIKSWWPFRKKVGNTHNLAAHRDEMVSNANEPELSNLEQRVSHSEELQSLKHRQTASQFNEPELSEPRQTVNHSGEQKLFSYSSFWKEMESFIFASKGAILVLYSRSRKEMAFSFKKYGPHVLHSLSENDLLPLVDLLISKKKWLEERPSQTYPFRAIPRRTPESNLQKSLECEADKKPSIPHAVVFSPATQKADVKKLVREILRQHPDGCNMGMIPKLFVEKYGYQLDIGKLGYSKLSLLIQSLPGVRTELEHFFPANHGKRDSGKETSILKTQETKLNDVVHLHSENEFHPHPKDDQKEYPWEELGPVAASNSNETELKLEPRQEAIELKTAIVPDYEPNLSDDDFLESAENNSCLTQSEYDHFVPADHGICDSGEETSILKTEETKLNDVVHLRSENEFHPHSEDDQKDYPWEELGPVSASNSNETDLELEPRQEAIELKTAIDPDYEPDLSDDDFLESGEDNSCLTQSEYGHFVPADHGICDSGKETSILKTQETKPNDVVHHNSEDDFYDSYSEDDQKNYPGEELGSVSVSNPNESDLESKPRQEAIELETAIDPDYEPNLSDDNSSESGGDNSCLTQPEEEGELKLNVEDSSLQNPDSTYGNQEREDGVNPNKASTEGNGLTDGLNPPRIFIPATISGNLSGGYKEKHMPNQKCSFDAEPASPKNKELIEGILQCLKAADGMKMPN